MFVSSQWLETIVQFISVPSHCFNMHGLWIKFNHNMVTWILYTPNELGMNSNMHTSKPSNRSLIQGMMTPVASFKLLNYTIYLQYIKYMLMFVMWHTCYLLEMWFSKTVCMPALSCPANMYSNRFSVLLVLLFYWI